MRQFKFRAYDKKNKKWLLGYDYGNLGGFSMFGEMVLMGDWGAVVMSNMQGEVDIVLNQFTGLKDRNDVEIYEGDIVRFTYWWFDGNEAESELIGSVIYIQERASYGLEGIKNAEWIKHVGGEDGSSNMSPFASWTFSSDDIEVIGNIYDNPETLN